MTPNSSGIILCQAANEYGNVKQEKKVLLSDLAKPFMISGWNDNEKALTGDDIEIRCAGNSLIYHSNATWLKDGQDLTETIITDSTDFSWSSTLKLTNISVADQGTYECVTKHKLNESDKKVTQKVILNVEKSRAPDISPKFTWPEGDLTNSGTVELKEYSKQVQMECLFSGLPTPKLTWYKNNVTFIPLTKRVTISNNNTLLEFIVLERDDTGDYICLASNRVGSETKLFKLEVDRKYFNYNLKMNI